MRTRLLPARVVCRLRRAVFDVLFGLYCAALLPFAPFSAAVVLILWLYGRAGQHTMGCLIPSLIASYLYLVHAFAVGSAEQASLDLSVLVALNVIALRTRISHEAVAGELSRRCAALEKSVIHDEMTAVYRGDLICELGQKEFDRARRGSAPFSVMLIGLAGLQEFSEDCGHAVGDLLIRDLAGAIGANLRSQDLLGRYRADTFLVLLPGTGRSGALTSAQRIRGEMRSRLRADVAMGVATYEQRTKNFAELVDQADFALFASRSHGRCRIEAWPASGGGRNGSGRVSAMGA